MEKYIYDEKNGLHNKLMKKMATQAGITEQLKAQEQLVWVQQINAINAQVREIINTTLIYASNIWQHGIQSHDHFI